MLIGNLDVRIDPWAVEYGSEAPGVSSDVDDEGQVDPNVELSEDTWRHLQPTASARVEPIVFIDGVRRIEGRLLVSDGLRVVHGAIGSYAVGSVVADGRASFGDHDLGRMAILGSGQTIGVPLSLGASLTYLPQSVSGTEADAPIVGLHASMREAEERFAFRLASEGRFVVADGPLNISYAGTGHVVGFVKRLMRLYITGALLDVITRMPIGARSPLFLIQRGRFSRYSWFVRLGTPLRMESAFTGLVRLEVAEEVGRARAVELANAISSWLPEFVPSRTRDPRAPQNLLPIGALEQYLRHQLGDARLIHRRLATLLASETP